MEQEKLFIEQSINKAIEVYKIEPKRIRADFRIEEAAKSSYKGREIYELIQNADDEMSSLESEDSKQISITYNKGYLSVANNGTPFDKPGIESLMLAYNSDKPERPQKTQVIGNKGTGFRAVLGWAKKVVIHSGNFHIAFSSEYSQSILQRLPKESIKGKTAATLAFPEWIGDIPYSSEFTTDVGLYIYDDPSIRNSIEKQLNKLDGEVLLFLNNATSIRIKTDEHEKVYRKRIGKKGIYIETIIDGKITTNTEWIITTEKDILNEEMYSISVAYKKDGSKPSRSVVYCYLPTDVFLPLPFLLHANLVLDDSRNHLIKDNKTNEIILKKAAAFIAATAEQRTTQSKCSSYDALSMCLPYESTSDSELEDYSFWNELSSMITSIKVLPTVNNQYISCSDNPIIYRNPIAKFLSGNEFLHLLKYSDDSIIKECLLSIKNRKVYKKEYLFDSLNSWAKRRKYSEQVAKENCNLIKALIDEGIECNGVNLIYGKNGKLSKSASNPICANTYNVTLDPPDFIRITMIDPLMEETLASIFECDFDELIDSLFGYNIRPFEPIEVVHKMETAIERHIERKDINTAKRCVEKSLVWMFDHYDLLSSNDIDCSIYLFNRSGDIVDANLLYLGHEYGNSIIEDLFVGFGEDIFAGNISSIVNENDFTILRRFLLKLGVSEKLRDDYHLITMYGIKSDIMSRFATHFWKELKYPVRFGSFELTAKSTGKHFSGKIHSLEHLEWILNNSDTGSILRWIKSDPELRSSIKNRSDKLSEVWVLFDPIREKRNFMKESTPSRDSVPSFISFMFDIIPWITVNGKRYKIEDCIIEDIPEDVCDVLVKPDIDNYIASDTYSKGQSRTVLRKDYEKILSDIGVNTTFAGLPATKLYAFINKLSEIPNGTKIAKTVYKKIYDDYDEQLIPDSERKKFEESGMLLCQDGEYYHPSECRYLDRRAFCKAIKDRNNLFDIRTRLSSPKIQDLFGVKKLEIRGELVGEPEIHPINSVFQKNFENYKICAFCYRYGNNKAKEKDELGKFKNLTVVVCKSLIGKLNDEVIQFGNYDYISSDNTTYYLCLPLSILSEKELLCHDVGDAISSIICDMLDLSEEKTTLRDLYMKNSDDRLKAVKDETEEDNIYDWALTEFGSYENNREEFISILTSLSPQQTEKITKAADIIDFDYFNSIANATYIIECLKKCGIDIDDYNEASIISDIDLTEYYTRIGSELKHQYKDSYILMKYRQLESLSIEEKSKFVSICYEYEEKEQIAIRNSVYYDPEAEFISQLGIADYLKVDINIDEVYRKNQNLFEANVSDKSHLIDFYSDNEITSLLYFGEFAELQNKYARFVEKNSEAIPQRDTPLNPDYSLSVVHGITKPVGVGKQHTGHREAGFSKESPKDEMNKAIIGLNGERKVFDWLKREYIDVEWVSENAKIAKVNPKGSADYGYDIKYKDGDVDCYVDVKASKSNTNELSFKITSYELEKALEKIENGGKYQIFYVTNANGNDSQIIILDDVVKDGELNQSAFRVENKVKIEYKLTGIVNSVEQEVSPKS